MDGLKASPCDGDYVTVKELIPDNTPTIENEEELRV